MKFAFRRGIIINLAVGNIATKCHSNKDGRRSRECVTTTNKTDKNRKMESPQGKYSFRRPDYPRVRFSGRGQAGTEETESVASRNHTQYFGGGRQSCATWVIIIVFEYWRERLFLFKYVYKNFKNPVVAVKEMKFITGHYCVKRAQKLLSLE